MNIFKKIAIAVLLLVMPLFVFADASFSTYEKESSQQLVSRGGELCSVLIMTDGTNAATVILYDVADSGDIAITNKLSEITVVGTENYGGRVWPFPVKFNNGLYAYVSGTGASYIVEWKR